MLSIICKLFSAMKDFCSCKSHSLYKWEVLQSVAFHISLAFQQHQVPAPSALGVCAFTSGLTLGNTVFVSALLTEHQCYKSHKLSALARSCISKVNLLQGAVGTVCFYIASAGVGVVLLAEMMPTSDPLQVCDLAAHHSWSTKGASPEPDQGVCPQE